MDTRDALADALTDAGFLVEQACTGAQALERMDQSGPGRHPARPANAGMDGAQFPRARPGTRARVIVAHREGSGRVLSLARNAKVLAEAIDLDQLERRSRKLAPA